MKRRLVLVPLFRELVWVEIWQDTMDEEHLGVANRKLKDE